MRHIRMLAFAVLMLVVLIGCASTGNGQKSSSFRAKSIDKSKVDLVVAPSALGTPNSQGAGEKPSIVFPKDMILVAVRYPAAFGNPEEFRRLYVNEVLGAGLDKGSKEQGSKLKSRSVPLSKSSSAAVDDSVVKTIFYAQALFKLLKERLPEGTVIQQPMNVEYIGRGSSGAQTPLSGVSAKEPLIAVDFFAYSDPNRENLLEKVPMTFGSLFSPLLTVRTSFLNSPATGGLLASTSAFIPHQFPPLLEWSPQNSLGLTLVDFLQEPITAEAKSDGSDSIRLEVTQNPNSSTNQVYAYPIERLELSNFDKLAHGAAVPDISILSGVADFIVSSLTKIDLQFADVWQRYRYYSSFDELAASAMLQPHRDEYEANFKVLDRYSQLEKEFLVTQSEEFSRLLLEGGFGEQCKKLLLAEQEVLEKKRSYARQENMHTALSIVFGALSGFAAYQGSPTGFSSSYMGSMAFVSAGARSSHLNQLVGSEFQKSFGSALERASSLTSELIEADASGQIESYSRLRSKMKERYNDLLKLQEDALGHRQDQFIFGCDMDLRDQLGQKLRGRWIGPCKSSIPFGTGSADIYKDYSKVGFFFGRLENGLPEGKGLLVSTEKNSPNMTALTGFYNHGSLHGFIRIDSPGSATKYYSIVEGVKANAASRQQFEEFESAQP